MNDKILIADSGSTKTDWALVENKKVVQRISTIGMNPFFQTQKDITEELQTKLVPLIGNESLKGVFFYGAGCIFDKVTFVKEAIESAIKANTISVETDLLGAAKALCGKEKGIACIIGTGSNSCLYDGNKIIENVSPLGFILGDEGSGSYLGKKLIGDLFKNMLPKELKEEFLEKYKLTIGEIINKVYKEPFPNRFLASLSPFIADHITLQPIHDLVFDAFVSFINRNIKHYNAPEVAVSFTGSIAFYYNTTLQEAAQHCNIRIGKIIKNPIEGLIEYHINKH